MLLGRGSRNSIGGGEANRPGRVLDPPLRVDHEARRNAGRPETGERAVTEEIGRLPKEKVRSRTQDSSFERQADRGGADDERS